MAKRNSPMSKRRRAAKRKKFLKIFIPSVLGVFVASMLIWYSCALFGWVEYSPIDILTGRNKPHCVVNKYKELEYTKLSDELTQADYDEYYNAMLADQPNTAKADERDGSLVREGDTLNIDFEGKLDGVAFDGGTASGYSLTIGSGKFIPGFEDGLIGVTVGDTVDLDLTFPETYPNNPDLAGKAVVFTVKVNYVVENKTKVDDAYIAANTEYNTVKEYEDGYLTAHLQESKTRTVRENEISDLVGQLVDNTEFYNLDDEINEYYKSMINYYTGIAKNAGTDLEKYVYYMNGQTLADFTKETMSVATLTIHEHYALKEVAKKEKIKVTDKTVSDYLERVMSENGYTSEEEFRKDFTQKEIEEMVLYDCAIDKLFEYAVVK